MMELVRHAQNAILLLVKKNRIISYRKKMICYEWTFSKISLLSKNW